MTGPDAEAVVFDLDGTLVRLDVDWDAVADEAAAVLRERDVTPPEDVWSMLDAAERAGHSDAVEAVVSRHERDGAGTSRRLPAADTLPGGPVGVCSLNCEAACRTALDEHDIAVDAVVGRDTVEERKPDPEPLLETVRRLEADPERTLFVGDSESDEVTADRAGTDFRYVSDWLRAYR